jgi:transposase
LDRASNYDKLEARIAMFDSLVARLARRDIADCRRLTIEINELEEQLRVLIQTLAPSLLALVGCGTLTAAKIIGETGGVTRFKSGDAFARHNGTAPLPVWSSNHQRHRLSRVGNRQINAALHRTAVTQIRVHQPAKDLFARRKATGDGASKPSESLNVTSQTPSTALSVTTPTNEYRLLLDRGASYRPQLPALTARSLCRARNL